MILVWNKLIFKTYFSHSKPVCYTADYEHGAMIQVKVFWQSVMTQNTSTWNLHRRENLKPRSMYFDICQYYNVITMFDLGRYAQEIVWEQSVEEDIWT